MLDWILRTFWIKKWMFSSVRKFFVDIEIIPELKNAVMREAVENSKKIQRQTSTLINTFIKICSINSFESLLLVIRLANWQMCFVSCNPPKDTPASTLRFSSLQRYLTILQNLEEICSFQYFFGRSCYYYEISHHNTAYKGSNPIEVVFHYFY